MRKKTAPRNLGDQIEPIRKIVQRRASASLMSDTKWRKVLFALETSGLMLDQCTIKYVDCPDEHAGPSGFWLYPPHKWVDSSVGPILLNSIEWLLFPRLARYPLHPPPPSPAGRLPPSFVEQDVDKAAALLATLGKIPMRLNEAGLLIEGHSMRASD